MRTHLLLSYALMAAAIARADLRAQSTIPVTIGERVRLTTATERGRHRLVGRVAAVGVDSLTLDTDGKAPAQVAISDVTALATSGGRRTNGKRGMVYGVLAGSAIGAVVGAPNTRQGKFVPCPTDGYGLSFCIPGYEAERGVSHLAGAVMGGLLGLAVCGVGGRFCHTERWIDRPLGARGLLTIAPVPGRAMAVGVSMHF